MKNSSQITGDWSVVTWSVLDTIVSNNDENDNCTFMIITMMVMMKRRGIYI